MKQSELRKLHEKVAKRMDEKRYFHTLGVEFTAASMAMRFGADMENAQLAGLFHDVAKCMTDSEYLKICEKNKLPVSDIERRNPFLLHGKVGAYIAEHDFDIADSDILNAITWHTTGRPGMSLLEKIVFTADYIEPGRNKAKNLEEIRSLAMQDIDAAVCKILKDTLEYLKESGSETDQQTFITYQYYAGGK